MNVYLAGRVAAESEGVVIEERRFPGRQGRLLFAYLAAAQGKPIPRDELAEALWEGSPPPTWEKALGVLASKLRGVLDTSDGHDSSALTAAFGCYRLELPEGSWVDVVAAQDAADAAEAALARDDLEAARRAAALAESLLRGPFLPGDDGTWVEQKRREFAGVRNRALSALAEACLRSGQAQEAMRWAEQAIDAEPFRESGYRRLMEAHIAAGNRAEALRVYERCRQLLAEELGAYPSPETEELYRDLLEAPPTTSVAQPTPPAVADGSSGNRASRRQKIAAGIVLLLAAGVTGAIFAVETRGGPPPKVVPNSLIRIDPRTLRVTQVVRVGTTQPDLVVAAGGFVWVTSHIRRDTGPDVIRNAGDRTLTRIDPSTGKVVPVGGGLAPCGLTADPSGDVWVANCYPRATGSRDDVVRVRARTLEFVKTSRVPGGDGYYRGLAYGDGSLWVGNIDGSGPSKPTLTEIDPQTRLKRTFRSQLPAGGLAWADGYGDLWVTHFDDGSVTRVNPASGLTELVHGVVVNPVEPRVDGGIVWVGDWALPEVARLHATGAPRPQTIALPTRKGFGGVWDIAVGAGAIWATTPRDGALWRIDPNTDKPTRIRLSYLPAGVTADANDVWVTVRGS